MDVLTHAAIGVAVARAGSRRPPLRETLLVTLAAVLPDVDVVGALGGSLQYLEWHRQFTHSLFMIPVLALLPVALARFILRRSVKLGRLYAVCLASVAVHVLADLSNVYGVGLLVPFSKTWYRLDAINILDIWIWAALLLFLIASALARLVGSEIGGATAAAGRGWAIFALCFIAVYGMGRVVLHGRAVAILDSYTHSGTVPLRVAAFPNAVNPFRWRGLVETESFYSVAEMDLLRDFDPASGRILYKPDPSPAIEAARKTEVFRRFLDFAQYPHWTVNPSTEEGANAEVSVSDLRFGLPPASPFTATAVLNPDNRVMRAWFQFGTPRQR